MGPDEVKGRFYYIDANGNIAFAATEEDRAAAVDAIVASEGSPFQTADQYWNSSLEVGGVAIWEKNADVWDLGFTRQEEQKGQGSGQGSGDGGSTAQEPYLHFKKEDYLDEEGKVKWFDNPEHNRLADLFHKKFPKDANYWVVGIEKMLDSQGRETGFEVLDVFQSGTGKHVLYRRTGGIDGENFIQTDGIIPDPTAGQSVQTLSLSTNPATGELYSIKVLTDDQGEYLGDPYIDYHGEIDPNWSPPPEPVDKRIRNQIASGITDGGQPYVVYQNDDGTLDTEFGDVQKQFQTAAEPSAVEYVNGVPTRLSAGGNPQIYDSTTKNWVDGLPPDTVSQVLEDGRTVIKDLRTGEVVQDLGTSYSTFIDRRDAAEDVRQFNVGEARLNRQFAATEDRMANEFAAEQDLASRELAARNYFETLGDLSANYRTLVQTSPQLANAATQQGQLVADILASGGDVLARTFFTRGGISPLPEITQSDLLQNLANEFKNIAQFEADAVTAENQRQLAAETRRAEEEFNAYQKQFDLDREAQYGQYVNEMQPTTSEETVRTGTNQAYEDAVQANLQGYQDYAANILAEGDQGAAIIAAGMVADAGGDPSDPAQVAAMVETIAQAATGASDLASTHTAASQLGWQADFIDPNDPRYSTFGTRTITTQPDPMSKSEWMAANPAQPLGYNKWFTDVGPSFTFSQPMSVPQVPTFDAPSQQELITFARATAPPAVQAMFQGTMPPALRFGHIPVPTLQQFSALTPAEMQNYQTNLLAEANIDLDTIRQASRQQFGTPSMDRSRDLARFRGYSV